MRQYCEIRGGPRLLLKLLQELFSLFPFVDIQICCRQRIRRTKLIGIQFDRLFKMVNRKMRLPLFDPNDSEAIVKMVVQGVAMTFTPKSAQN